MSKPVDNMAAFNQEVMKPLVSAQDCSMEEACGLGLMNDPVPPAATKEPMAREIPRPY